MGPRLAGDVHSALLGVADKRNAFLCGNVADVEFNSRLVGKLDIPLYLLPLGFGGILYLCSVLALCQTLTLRLTVLKILEFSLI